MRTAHPSDTVSNSEDCTCKELQAMSQLKPSLCADGDSDGTLLGLLKIIMN